MRKLSLLLVLLLVVCFSTQCTAQPQYTHYSDIHYQHTDLEAMEAQTALIEELAEGDNFDALLDAVIAFDDAYSRFYTDYLLSDIHYSANLKDSYWEQENSFCVSAEAQVNRMNEEICYALAASKHRDAMEREYCGEGFFLAYDGDMDWDDTLTALLDREAELISKYYTQADHIGTLFSYILGRDEAAAQTLVDLILVRNEIAAYYGYDCYEDYINDISYYRDYEKEEMDAYLKAIQEVLVPIYRDYWSLSVDLDESKEDESFAYVRNAAQRMGGTIWDAFQVMEEYGLYDISYSRNKFDTSFVAFLYAYEEPFLFFNPERTLYDHLTLSHEFGHFCNDFASCGSVPSIDVNEIFSQAMEYLALFYTEGTEDLLITKMCDSLATYVEQACFAEFERNMYRLENPTVEALCDLYEQLGNAYGFDSYGFDPLDFVTYSHFYTSPMYVSSYIISNDAAIQFYQMEVERSGSGLRHFQDNLDTEEPYFMAFLESAGLESPFAPGRLDEIAALFQTIFANVDA